MLKGNLYKYIRLSFKNLSFLIINFNHFSWYSILKFLFNRKLFSSIGYNKQPHIIQKLVYFRATNKERIESEIQDSDLVGVLKLALFTDSIKGDIIELGAYKGGTSTLLAMLLNQINSKKKLYICDTFEGHPYDDDHGRDKKGFFSDTNTSLVKAKFRKFNVAKRIEIIKGMFEKSLYQSLKNKSFSFAFVDCDLYQSSKFALDFLIPRMQKGSIIAIHDYANNKYGISKAIHEICFEKGFKIQVYPIPHLRM